MPNEKKPKTKCVEYLRHAEYYDMQSTFDELYARSQAGEIFDGLMDVILSRENILLAYRNIKSNSGSFTPGTDIAPGDAIFFDWDLDGGADHVGIVIGTDGSRVYTVEGNSGDACKIKSYDLNYACIKGYGLMNW